MYIDGWAFKENEDELMKRNQAIYNDLVDRNIKDNVVVEGTISGYANIKKYGKIKEGFKISERDLAVYLDGGNLCFGGESTINGTSFAVTIFTD
jgi:hypothetical protein